jgi:hypothetical protein
MHKHAKAPIPSTSLRTSLFLFCIFILLVSCSSPTPEAIPTTETPVIPTDTAVSPSDTPAPVETPTQAPIITPDLERPQYVMDLQVNYSNKSAVVDQTITYPNWTGETLTELVLAVEPNLWSGGFSLKSLAVDDQPVTNYTLENLNQRLEIPLPQPLEPGRTITLKINYGLILPQMQAYSDPSRSTSASVTWRIQQDSSRSDRWPALRVLLDNLGSRVASGFFVALPLAVLI